MWNITRVENLSTAREMVVLQPVPGDPGGGGGGGQRVVTYEGSVPDLMMD